MSRIPKNTFLLIYLCNYTSFSNIVLSSAMKYCLGIKKGPAVHENFFLLYFP